MLDCRRFIMFTFILLIVRSLACRGSKTYQWAMAKFQINIWNIIFFKWQVLLWSQQYAVKESKYGAFRLETLLVTRTNWARYIGKLTGQKWTMVDPIWLLTYPGRAIPQPMPYREKVSISKECKKCGLVDWSEVMRLSYRRDHQRETTPWQTCLQPEWYVAATHHLPSDSHVDQRQLVLHNHFLAKWVSVHVVPSSRSLAIIRVIIVMTGIIILLNLQSPKCLL